MVLLWAKTSNDTDPVDQLWHPLILHMLDVAITAEAILAREPECTRERIAEILGLPWKEALPWLLVIIACHDLGKACPEFQSKWSDMSGLRTPRIPDTTINHAYVSQIALVELLKERDWPPEIASLVADAIGCHHGERISPSDYGRLEGHVCLSRRDLWKEDWVLARRDLFTVLADIFQPGCVPIKETLTGPDFMLLTGLTSFADWIGSNDQWFPFGDTEDCNDLPGWLAKRRLCAETALNAIGWQPRTPLIEQPQTFHQVFGFTPRPLQKAVADALRPLNGPAILLVEAPMGEGKTEAAFFSHLELQRRFGHRGLYVALPTKATGNAMFKRTLDFLKKRDVHRCLDLQLLHGATLLNDSFQNLKFSGIHDPTQNGEVRAGEWFTSKKRALLSEYGVGTIDQALLPILPVRHNFVRLWGLANRVVIFDEIHAYDAYTGTLLIHLLRWLLALGSSVVLLSATLSPAFRRKLAAVVNSAFPEPEAEYPRLTVYSPHEAVTQIHFTADPERRLTVQLQGLSTDLDTIRGALEQHLSAGGLALALVNTVQRAQDLYQSFPEGTPVTREGKPVGKRLADGTEIFLFHARFPADDRQVREDCALDHFGEKGDRKGRKILIATQVVEQSLDLDFDLMISDLAPIDLLLQRAGRLWRHSKNHPQRAVSAPLFFIVGLADDTPPSFGKPLWWGAIYREDVLLRTWSLLHGRETVQLPEDIDFLVQEVYEELGDVPDSLQDWLDKAMVDGEGQTYAQRLQADQAILGFPDDESWNDPGRFVLHDEDAMGVHRSLMAKTRLGEDSVTVVPLAHGIFKREEIPDFAQAKAWYLRCLSLSRKQIVKTLQAQGVPEGWKQSSLLRNCLPLLLDEQGRWIEDPHVRLDKDLGLVYAPKEEE